MPRGRKILKTIELEECTVVKAAEEFYANNRIKGLSEDTQKAYKGYVERFIGWCGKEVLLTEISSKFLDEYVQKKIDDGAKAVSVATTMVHLRRFFNFCIERNYIEEIQITIPKYEEEIKEPYSDEELEKLLKKPATDNWVEYRNWVMVNYFFSTGQRLSTVLNIKVSHVNLRDNTVILKWNKDKKQKYMPISASLTGVLREYIEISDLQMEDYLFPEYEGGKLKKRSAQDAIADYNRSRGVERTSIHLFRHTFAKHYIMNGGNPAKLQKLMNHKTIEQTMKYVALYGSDVSKDYDLYNPLDTFKRSNYKPKKRVKVNIE